MTRGGLRVFEGHGQTKIKRGDQNAESCDIFKVKRGIFHHVLSTGRTLYHV